MASEPTYVTAFKAYVKASPSKGELADIEKDFLNENDRACGILFGSWVDMALERAIRSILRKDLSKELEKRLFDYDGPLGTFGTRVNIGSALGIFGRKTFHDLDLIRVLRNEFAHCRRPLHFHDKVVADICSHFSILETDQKRSLMVREGPTTEKELAKIWNDLSRPKARFAAARHSIAGGLFDFAGRQKRQDMEKSALP